MAYVGAIIAAIGVAVNVDQNNQARKDQAKARRQQDAARGDQAAQQAAEAAQARRQQVREERVKRAQILQSAANTGADGSSGAMGAIGGMQTQLQSNIGLSQGNQDRAMRIGVYSQGAANSMGDAQTHANRAALGGQMTNLGFSLFSQAQPKKGTPQGTVQRYDTEF